MNTKQLRQKILDLAIRGKLVPQDPNDEPASVLLARVKAEKERLIANGKIKRSKKTSTTTDMPHYPFELPDGWCWLQLDEVADIARGGSPRPISQFITDDPYGVNWIKIGDTEKDGKYINSCAQKIIKEGVKRSRVVKKGDFLLTNSMSLGRPYILNVDGCIHDGWLVISPIGKPFEIDFLYYLLSSSFAYSQFSEKAGGAVVSNLNIEKVAHSLFPLPPLDEQKRIVVEIERILDAIEIVNDSTHELSLAISNVKAKVLELAISGRLVPQDPADEPAEELLRRINPSAVPADKSHYGQLPNGWCYTTMNYVCQLYDGEKIDGKALINLDAKYLRGKSEGNTLNSGRYVPAKTTMILVDGENSGEIFTAPINGYQGSTFKLLNINGEMNVEYVKMIIRIYQKRLRDNKVGSAIPHLNKKMFREILVPVPPIAEQVRIVDYTNDLLSKINILTETL